MNSQPLARIRAFIVERFPSARNRTLGDEDRLLANGILDSLGVLDLVAFLESEFGISVADDDLVPAHFESLRSLAAFIATKSGNGSGRPT